GACPSRSTRRGARRGGARPRGAASARGERTLVRLQRVFATRHVLPQSAGPNCEPDEARGRPQPEAYAGIRCGLRPTENVACRGEPPCGEARAESIWRSQVGPALAAHELTEERDALAALERCVQLVGDAQDRVVDHELEMLAELSVVRAPQ